jgi:hypothetical protein
MNSNINNAERLQLKQLVDEMQCENNTDNIRKLKHSTLIRDDVRKIDTLRNTNPTLSQEELKILCESQCKFLNENYNDIFNKIVKNELDLTIMTKFLTVLKLIEDGRVDQHEGSVMVGKILKELYLDSAVKHADNLDKQYADQKESPIVGKTISWKEYKSKMVSRL